MIGNGVESSFGTKRPVFRKPVVESGSGGNSAFDAVILGGSMKNPRRRRFLLPFVTAHKTDRDVKVSGIEIFQFRKECSSTPDAGAIENRSVNRLGKLIEPLGKILTGGGV